VFTAGFDVFTAGFEDMKKYASKKSEKED